MDFNPIDISMYGFTWYVFILTILVENGYQLVKVIRKKKIKKQVLNSDTQMIEEKEIDKWVVLFLLVIGILITLSFYPNTIFTFMPFKSVHWILDIFYSSLFLSMSASSLYNFGDRATSLSLGFIGRIIKMF